MATANNPHKKCSWPWYFADKLIRRTLRVCIVRSYMSKMLDAINKAKIISIDFDGVLLRKFLNRRWSDRSINSGLITNIDNMIGAVLQTVRVKEKNVEKALTTLFEMDKRLVLLTGRNNVSAKFALKWLKAHGIYALFENFYFPDAFFTGDPNKYKFDAIGKYEIDLHIDDDPTVIDLCSRNYIDKSFILYGTRRVSDELKERFQLRENVGFLDSWVRIRH